MPSPVDKYYKQIKEDSPSYSDSQAWATAWSIYCKHVNPGSPSCKKPPGEYLKKEASSMVSAFERDILSHKVAYRYIMAMSLPEDVEAMLEAWRRQKDRMLDSLLHGLQSLDDLILDFKGIEQRVRGDRDLRQLIREDVQDADTLMKLVEDLGELGVAV